MDHNVVVGGGTTAVIPGIVGVVSSPRPPQVRVH